MALLLGYGRPFTYKPPYDILKRMAKKKHHIKNHAAKGGNAIISKRGSEYMRMIGKRGRAKQLALKESPTN